MTSSAKCCTECKKGNCMDCLVYDCNCEKCSGLGLIIGDLFK